MTDSQYRICNDCDRMVDDSIGHSCMTPEYVAGFALGMLPHHLHAPAKVALSTLGLSADDHFVNGFHAGLGTLELTLIEKLTVSLSEHVDAKDQAWRDGSWDEYTSIFAVDASCHCGDSDCLYAGRRLKGMASAEPCHCGQADCLMVLGGLDSDVEFSVCVVRPWRDR